MALIPLDQPRLETGLAELAARDADLRRALARLGPPAARVRPPGFATLLRIVVAQQVSTHAAAAIWARLEHTLGDVTPARLLDAEPEALRAAGLSARKADYARGLAGAVVRGALDPAALEAMTDEEVVAAITALRGFGRWSAEIYLLFALGRSDVFPAGDLALRAALGRLKGHAQTPDEKASRALVEAWQPWRGCGAVFLWHYYGSATLDRT